MSKKIYIAKLSGGKDSTAMVEYYVDEYPSYRRVQHIFFIEKKVFFDNVRN